MRNQKLETNERTYTLAWMRRRVTEEHPAHSAQNLVLVRERHMIRIYFHRQTYEEKKTEIKNKLLQLYLQ